MADSCQKQRLVFGSVWFLLAPFGLITLFIIIKSVTYFDFQTTEAWCSVSLPVNQNVVFYNFETEHRLGKTVPVNVVFYNFETEHRLRKTVFS